MSLCNFCYTEYYYSSLLMLFDFSNWVARKIVSEKVTHLNLYHEKKLFSPILPLLLIYFKGQAVRLRRTWGGHGIWKSAVARGSGYSGFSRRFGIMQKSVQKPWVAGLA